jgi:hypothetical protein
LLRTIKDITWNTVVGGTGVYGLLAAIPTGGWSLLLTVPGVLDSIKGALPNEKRRKSEIRAHAIKLVDEWEQFLKQC